MADLQGPARRQYVADLFARIVPRYDLMNTLMTGGLHHRWRRLAVSMATRDLDIAAGNGTALDVATGTGDLALAFVRHTRIQRVVGLDLVAPMVCRACSKGRSRGLGGRVRFAVGDALSLPFADDSFVCAGSAWGLRNMPDLAGALSEMVRVVRPGGRVVSLESVPVEGGPLRPLFKPFFHHVVPLMGQLIGGDRAAYTYLPQSVERFLTVVGLAQAFEEAGLKDVGHRRVGMGAVAIHWGTVSR